MLKAADAVKRAATASHEMKDVRIRVLEDRAVILNDRVARTGDVATVSHDDAMTLVAAGFAEAV